MPCFAAGSASERAAGGIAELWIPRLLSAIRASISAGFPQLGAFNRVIKKAIRTTECNVWVLREHIRNQEPRVVVPL